jgi:hypothetical protein
MSCIERRRVVEDEKATVVVKLMLVLLVLLLLLSHKNNKKKKQQGLISKNGANINIDTQGSISTCIYDSVNMRVYAELKWYQFL